MKKRVTGQCEYCKDDIEVHHVSKHQRTCYLNPENLAAISEYLQRGFTNSKLLNRASFYRWAKQNHIMTSVWVTKRMGLETWTQAVYQLLIYAYLKKNISFEKVDLLLSLLTDGTMWLDVNDYRTLVKEADTRSDTLEDVSLHSNFMSLLASIIIRAKRDIWQYEANEDDDEGDESDVVKEAVAFLHHFVPEVLESCLKKGQISDEAIKHVVDLECSKSYSTDLLCSCR